ncbi:hypothetical protein ACFC26_21610 [Kitasatospora purpeofusca]|uniref:hypothetical protein n=1 Tax=Kitasatospora purpeofusca TaxID=67352 RepID=UPI0035D661AA
MPSGSRTTVQEPPLARRYLADRSLPTSQVAYLLASDDANSQAGIPPIASRHRQWHAEQVFRGEAREPQLQAHAS